jgi:hypothetical protein
LFQANAMTVFQVDGRYQQHGFNVGSKVDNKVDG